MDETLERLGHDHQGALGASIEGYAVAVGELTVTARAADIVKVATYLKTDAACQFICIIDCDRRRLARRARSASTSSIISSHRA